jgi:signal peptidase I
MTARVWGPVLILVVAIGLALFMFDFPRAPDDQMAPGVRKGDLLFACRVCGAPERGDVVLFSPPDAPGQMSVRRVLGVPGDRVEIRKGAVLINGSPPVSERGGEVRLTITEPDGARERALVQANETDGAHAYRTLRDTGVKEQADAPALLLDGAYFVLSDLRTLAHDSREYGPVQRAQIRSRVLRVINAADGDAGRHGKLP